MDAADPALTDSVLADAPPTVLREGRYVIRFARSAEDLRAALSLRYQVFNLELGEGLEESHLTGVDEDGFDVGCHHLLVQFGEGGPVVGTYRLQTAAMARRHRGFYSDGEFDLSGLGARVLEDSVELGRACIVVEHRKQKVLFGLWRGLAAYLLHAHKRYLFGCCSFTSQDPALGLAADEYLRRAGQVWPRVRVATRPPHRCEGPAPDAAAVAAVKLPTLFSTYLRFGALACSEPAIDRAFKTIDFLVLMDTCGLPEQTLNLFFGAERPW